MGEKFRQFPIMLYPARVRLHSWYFHFHIYLTGEFSPFSENTAHFHKSQGVLENSIDSIWLNFLGLSVIRYPSLDEGAL